jgi:nitroimidazol reductase NimA-like FMN-containing flavoprotein (pyridoxamine 5'-phosphate oxidase superfamily)
LSYLGADGGPRVVPVGFLWRDDRFIVCTATNAPKVSALRQRPQAAVYLHRNASPPQLLLLRGTAQVDIVDGVAEEFLAASRKSGGPEDWATFEAQQQGVYEQMARIAITVEWAKLIDFRATMPIALQHLIDGGEPFAG